MRRDFEQECTSYLISKMTILCWVQTDSALPLAKAGGDDSFIAAYKEVAELTAQGEERKRSPYHRYDTELCTKIAKHA